MTIDNQAHLRESGACRPIGCTLLRTPTYALHIHVQTHLDMSTLPDTVTAVAAQLVLVPRCVVLETGWLPDRPDSHTLAIGHIAALVRRAGIQLLVVAPECTSPELLLSVGILPADARFSSVNAALSARL